MVVHFGKWGHSVALRIPSDIARQISAIEGQAADVFVEDGRLVVVPVQKPTYDLAELVEGITSENLHGETETGSAVGNEFC